MLPLNNGSSKDLLDKSCSEMEKLDFNDVNNQKPTHLVNLGFAVNHAIEE